MDQRYKAKRNYMKVEGGSFSTHPNGLDMHVLACEYAQYCKHTSLSLIFKNMEEIIKTKYINPSEDNMHWVNSGHQSYTHMLMEFSSL